MTQSADTIHDTPGDGKLLQRFARDADQAAFGEVVRRHQSLVLGVCRAILGRTPDAEDAAQAVFITLTRKAASLGGRATVAGWLHRVAWYVATRARTAAAIRRQHEREAALMNGNRNHAPDERVPLDELHEALSALPEKYRLALILHHLEGRSEAETAVLVGCSASAASFRLSRGRQLLRDRLARKGVGVTMAALVATMAAEATAHASTTLAPAIMQAAAMTAQSASAAALSPQAFALAKGAMHMLFVAKLKLAGAVIVAAVVLGAGAGVAIDRSLAQRQPQATHPAPAAAPTTGPKLVVTNIIWAPQNPDGVYIVSTVHFYSRTLYLTVKRDPLGNEDTRFIPAPSTQMPGEDAALFQAARMAVSDWRNFPGQSGGDLLTALKLTDAQRKRIAAIKDVKTAGLVQAAPQKDEENRLGELVGRWRSAKTAEDRDAARQVLLDTLRQTGERAAARRDAAIEQQRRELREIFTPAQLAEVAQWARKQRPVTRPASRPATFPASIALRDRPEGICFFPHVYINAGWYCLSATYDIAEAVTDPLLPDSPLPQAPPRISFIRRGLPGLEKSIFGDDYGRLFKLGLALSGIQFDIKWNMDAAKAATRPAEHRPEWLTPRRDRIEKLKLSEAQLQKIAALPTWDQLAELTDLTDPAVKDRAQASYREWAQARTDAQRQAALAAVSDTLRTAGEAAKKNWTEAKRKQLNDFEDILTVEQREMVKKTLDTKDHALPHRPRVPDDSDPDRGL
jgi:RNA polymerase sigma factor (sigma-70 family)